jgi:methylglyoxal reductase
MELVEVLRQIAAKVDKPVSHVAINWVNQQEGVTTALVGAKTPEQAEQNAAAGEWELSCEQLNTIESAYRRIFG